MKIVRIGRGENNDVIINDSLVSRAHCQIIQDDQGYYRLIDTGSANGTYINGSLRRGEVILNKTDIIRIGNSTLPWQSYFNNNNGGTVIGPQNGGGGYYPPTPNPHRHKPNNFLVWAILCTIFCCLPFGIVSIVYASKVDGLWYAGEYEEAEDAASKARTWFWLSFASAILLAILYYCIYGAALLAFL